MVDWDLVARKLADLDQYLGQLGEYRGITAEETRSLRQGRLALASAAG